MLNPPPTAIDGATYNHVRPDKDGAHATMTYDRMLAGVLVAGARSVGGTGAKARYRHLPIHDFPLPQKRHCHAALRSAWPAGVTATVASVS